MFCSASSRLAPQFPIAKINLIEYIQNKIINITMSSSSSSSSSDRGSSKKRIYVTGYSSKEDPHDIKKIFKKFGKIEEFSWKGKFCFIVCNIHDELAIRGSG
jgi:hypothetical protein